MRRKVSRHHRLLARRNLIAFASLWVPLAGAVAAPTVGMVIETCERALAGGYRDREAALCDWYVRPCGACGVAAPPMWCLPASPDPAGLAREVLTALQAGSDLSGPAQPAVERILRAHYPCAAQDGHHDQLVDP